MSVFNPVCVKCYFSFYFIIFIYYKVELKVQIKIEKAYPAQYTGVSTITD